MSEGTPRFSLILTTRNRPALFGAALASLMAQSFANTEIIVVDDGSDEAHAAAYQALIDRARAQLGERLQHHVLLRRRNGHGSGYAMNFGVDNARGEYVCFLDDDDLWTDAGHLQRADEVIRAAAAEGLPPDLYMSNQEATRAGQRVVEAVWIEALEMHLRARGRRPDARGAYRVGIEELLLTRGFCHLNCLVVRRALYLAVGGRDEGTGWEGDRDLWLRLIDSAGLMLHHPAVTARHHVPDPAAGTSITTALGLVERRLWQLRVTDRAMLFLKSPALREHGRRHKGYALKRLASELASQGDWRTASRYALRAMAVLPTAKWATFTIVCLFQRLFQRARD